MKMIFHPFIILLLLACSNEPQAIEYGKDQCDFCSMGIVDRQHAAQTVTNKGKQFKYDAIECMIHDLAGREESEFSHILVNDYNKPGTMVNAMQATYLISKKIKSPMGAFLSAGVSEDEMQALQVSHGGQLYSWENIRKEIGENH